MRPRSKDDHHVGPAVVGMRPYVARYELRVGKRTPARVAYLLD